MVYFNEQPTSATQLGVTAIEWTLRTTGRGTSQRGELATRTITSNSNYPRGNATVSETCESWRARHPINPQYKDHVKYSLGDNPCRCCQPKTDQDFWNVEKRVVVRSVFPERRVWNGHPSSYVFMVEIERMILSRGSLVMCQVGNQSTATLDHMVPQLALEYVDHHCPQLTHATIVVHCYLPLESANGSRAFLFYRVNPQLPIIAAESEEPLRIPGPPVSSSNPENVTIVSCIAVQYGQPPFLGEWVRYQKTIGISHIQMIAEPSILDSGALNCPSVRKAMLDGFLSVDIWHKWFSAAQIYDHSQLLAYEDCLYRFQGTYDYLFLNDADDFFVPLQSDHRHISYYIKKYCAHAGTCELSWYQMCPTCGTLHETAEDGNVTGILALHDRCRRGVKSLHRIPMTFDVSTHTGHRWVSGYGREAVSSNDAYVAHIRLL